MTIEEQLSTRVRELPLVFLDLETTGLKPEAGDEILEFGAVKTVGDQQTAEMDTLIKPTRPIPPEAAKVHGITDLFVMGSPSFEMAADEILTFIGDAVIVAHNAPFDAGFLATGLQTAGKKIPGNLVLDTLSLARTLMPASPNHKLETLKRHFGVVVDRAHRALDDSRALARVFSRMLEKHFHAIDGGPTLAEVVARAVPLLRLIDFADGLPFKVPEMRALARWAIREKTELLVGHLPPGRPGLEEVRLVPTEVTAGKKPELKGTVKGTGKEIALAVPQIRSIRKG
ncbi:MAG: 3'-5' exonuclease [Candidatus Riflebacteria bacterium]|nr:3'-5' exonuclease [Candidatus Riflebacteria bacterium]